MLESRASILCLVFVIIRCESKITLGNNLIGRSAGTLRLPNDTKPISYDIHIVTNIDNGKSEFSGRVSITLEALEDTDKIVIHANQLLKIKVSLIDVNSGIEFLDVKYYIDSWTEFMVIYSNSNPLALKAGNKYFLTISYIGIHNKGTFGFYSTSYKYQAVDIPLAVTNFEPTGARQAFPCYDEPGFKAYFTISITHASHYHAVSNMPVAGQPMRSKNGKTTTTTFKITPVMSTYTLAFIVSDYSSSTLQYKNINHRIFFPRSSKHFGNQSLQIAAEILDELQNYFGVAYPLNKIDHISVRDRFGSAMENFGLIIYKYGMLLPYSNSSKLFNLDTMTVIAHELTHQWFGNLVSPKWWTWSWLNEGLSTFYSYKIIDLLYPSLNAMDYLILYEMGLVQWTDENFLRSRLPLTRYVEHLHEIEEQFGEHAYYKAAYILQMFEHALTPQTFKKGVVGYLRKFQFSSVDEDDFFECLQQAATEDDIPYFKEPGSVAEAFKSWTNHYDYPLVSVTRNYEEGTFTLKQKGFLGNEEYFWIIPITFTTKNNADFNNTKTILIFPNISEIVVDPRSYNITLSEDEWIILNINQVAPYRISYDSKNRQLISKTLMENPEAISSYNKAQILRDAEALYQLRNLTIDDVLDLISYLENEIDVIPGFEGLQILRYFRFLMYFDADTKDYFEKYSTNLISKLYERIGPTLNDKDTPAEEFVRSFLLDYYCKINEEKCPASKLLKEFLNGEGDFDIPLLNVIRCHSNSTILTESEFMELNSRLDYTNDEILSDRMKTLLEAYYCPNKFIH